MRAGGGLISGITLAAKALKPSIQVFAAEPKGADDAAQSKAAGKLITMAHPNTIADGLRSWMGSLTWYVMKECQYVMNMVCNERMSICNEHGM